MAPCSSHARSGCAPPVPNGITATVPVSSGRSADAWLDEYHQPPARTKAATMAPRPATFQARVGPDDTRAPASVSSGVVGSAEALAGSVYHAHAAATGNPTSPAIAATVSTTGGKPSASCSTSSPSSAARAITR